MGTYRPRKRHRAIRYSVAERIVIILALACVATCVYDVQRRWSARQTVPTRADARGAPGAQPNRRPAATPSRRPAATTARPAPVVQHDDPTVRQPTTYTAPPPVVRATSGTTPSQTQPAIRFPTWDDVERQEP